MEQQGVSRGMSRHMLIMVLCCLIPLAALSAIFIFKVPVSQTLSFGLILICPLSMLLMMGTMGGHGHEHDASGSQALSDGSDNPAASSKGGAACH
jgi:Protein of unknown function (DUF2933)